MNIIKAMGSGCRFKRQGHVDYFYLTDLLDRISLHQEDILADDWEIEEEKIELSWTAIEKALVRSAGLAEVRKDLGFKE